MDKGDMARKLHMSRKYLNQLLCQVESGSQMPTPSSTAKQSQIITLILPKNPLAVGMTMTMQISLQFGSCQLLMKSSALERNIFLSMTHLVGTSAASKGFWTETFACSEKTPLEYCETLIYQLIKESQGANPRPENSGPRTNVASASPPHALPCGRRGGHSLNVCKQAVVCTVVHSAEEHSQKVEEHSRSDRERSRAGSLWEGADGAFITLTVVTPDDCTVLSILDHFHCPNKPFLMAEFPGVQLPSFDSSPVKGSIRAERARVNQYWLEHLAEITLCEAVQLVSTYTGVKYDWDRNRSEVDLRCLAEADVIGVTTSGIARNLEMLQKLQSKVVICEKAGEVLEAHLLTALLPSVEHAILIGDHQQLRPQVQNYGLSRENHNGGNRYSLDVSLFERLVNAW
ncbi:hypothetical protein BDV12DRAFT_196658 [Aspergillus spectabilis]